MVNEPIFIFLLTKSCFHWQITTINSVFGKFEPVLEDHDFVILITQAHL